MLKVVITPEVHLLGSMRLREGVAPWLESFNAPGFSPTTSSPDESLAEFAGRACYSSYSRPRPGGSEAYLENVISGLHGSVFAHSTLVFGIRGVSRNLSHELVRHHVGTGVSQLSQRYVDMSEVRFVCPPGLLEGMRQLQGYPHEEVDTWAPRWKPEARAYDEWQTACLQGLNSYESIVESLTEAHKTRHGNSQVTTDGRKAIRQVARGVLNGSAETAMVFSGNLRAWRNIIEQRCSPHADREICRLANALFLILERECPLVFKDYVVEAIPDTRGMGVWGNDNSLFGVSTEYRKI